MELRGWRILLLSGCGIYRAHSTNMMNEMILCGFHIISGKPASHPSLKRWPSSATPLTFLCTEEKKGMDQKVKLRSETDADASAITDVTVPAALAGYLQH